MLVHGKHTVETLLKYKSQIIKKLYLSKSQYNRLLIEIKGINYEVLDNEKISKICKSDKHQGLVADIDFKTKINIKHLEKKLCFSSDKTQRVLILDSIQDPRNLGACLRTALAFDFNTVIINIDGSAPINEHVFKSSVGAILNLNICYVTNLSNTIKSLKKIGFWVLGLDGRGEGSIFSEKFSSKTAVVLGSEGSGIRKLVKENCDHLIKIPISNKVESLNISVAAGIIMYELKKQHIS